MATYFVYIMTNRSRTLYTGVTNNLERRVEEHRGKLVPGFTQKYNITQLVYYEEHSDVRDAIAREKEIKGWLRRKKIALVEGMNPHWDDLGGLSISPGNLCKNDLVAPRPPVALRRPHEGSSLRSE